jgi:hypothetical protein
MAYFLKLHTKSEALNGSTALFIFYEMRVTLKFFFGKSFSKFLINTIDCIGLENFNAKIKSSTQHFAEVYMVLIH